MLFGFSQPGGLGKGYDADAVDELVGVLERGRAGSSTGATVAGDEMVVRAAELPLTRTGRRYVVPEVDAYLFQRMQELAGGTRSEPRPDFGARPDFGELPDSAPSPTARGAGSPLRAEDVSETRFTAARRGTRYAMDDVDDLLDAIAEAVGGRRAMTADDIDDAKLGTVKLGAGYSAREVDDFLDRAAAALRAGQN